MNDVDVQRTVDRADIAELLALWLFALDTFDWETLRDRAFANDLEWEWQADDGHRILSDQAHGRDATIAWFAAAIPASTRARHVVTNHIFEFDRDTIRTTSYLNIVNTVSLLNTANGLMTAEHVRTSDGWRIRRLQVLAPVPAAALSNP